MTVYGRICAVYVPYFSTREVQSKRQTLSLTRLQAYGEAMGQLIEGSIAFGPILERIKVKLSFLFYSYQ